MSIASVRRVALTATRPPDLRRWMLWGVLVLAVAALGAMAWRLARRV
jgi:hypothetical protein